MMQRFSSSISRSANFSKNVLPATAFMTTQHRYASGKDIRFHTECRELMAKGVDLLADAVQVTLGPKGRNVVIEQSYGAPKITKDGVTVAKSITFKDKFMDAGAKLVRDVANQTNEKAGDGTTSATVLARAIYKEGCKAVAAGLNPQDIRRGILAAVDKVVEKLKSSSTMINTKEQITQVAVISANGDKEVGNLISAAMEKVGKEGVITVQDGKTLTHELEVVEGMKFDRGYISPYFITDAKTQKCEFENPYILLSDKKISSSNVILPILEEIYRVKRPLVIIAEDVESEGLATLILNKYRGGLQLCAVKAPGFGDNRKANLEDMAILTGGQVFSTEEIGHKLEDARLEHLGSVKKITISKDDTVMLDGAGSKDAIEERCLFIRSAIQSTTSEYEKEKLQERLAKLSSGVAVIKVGGANETEVNETKDRITDALNATRAACDEGIVPGGGSALLYASTVLSTLKFDKFDKDVGVRIVEAACKVPCATIVQNAGGQGAVVVEELLRRTDKNTGYDAQNGKYVNMIESGIIDPVKVVRTAFTDAARIASLMVTTEATVVEIPDENPPPAASPKAGYGGDMF
eukprot:c20493_g1_i3.p1 GENE.c20493_g1_i3~~c20493_g1_i3.p1  ORF type:complete len:579 (-),score=256.18 c20493_g1_i3:58-1794(-)